MTMMPYSDIVGVTHCPTYHSSMRTLSGQGCAGPGLHKAVAFSDCHSKCHDNMVALGMLISQFLMCSVGRVEP